MSAFGVWLVSIRVSVYSAAACGQGKCMYGRFCRHIIAFIHLQRQDGKRVKCTWSLLILFAFLQPPFFPVALFIRFSVLFFFSIPICFFMRVFLLSFSANEWTRIAPVCVQWMRHANESMNDTEWIRKSYCGVFRYGTMNSTPCPFACAAVQQKLWIWWMAFCNFFRCCSCCIRNRRYPILMYKLVAALYWAWWQWHEMKIGPVSGILGSLVNDDRSMRAGAAIYVCVCARQHLTRKGNEITMPLCTADNTVPIPQYRALSLEILIGH